jgi:dihydroxyacid dehydratase/phosphogluconate dehydratase
MLTRVASACTFEVGRMVLVAGKDKSVPAQLMAIARCDLRAVPVNAGDLDEARWSRSR